MSKKIIAAFAFCLLLLGSPSTSPAQEPNLMDALGAKKIAEHKLSIFIPNRGGDNTPLNQFMWVNKFLEDLARIFGGATALPPAIGWGKDGRDGALRESETVVVYSLVSEAMLTDDNIEALELMLYKFAEASKLETIFCEYDGQLYTIAAQK